jgi:hypothetical protein
MPQPQPVYYIASAPLKNKAQGYTGQAKLLKVAENINTTTNPAGDDAQQESLVCKQPRPNRIPHMDKCCCPSQAATAQQYIIMDPLLAKLINRTIIATITRNRDIQPP